MSEEQNQEIIRLLKQSIAASNRTTHAVRAIVLPSTIILVTLLIVIPFSLLGVASGSPAVLIIGVVGLLAGAVVAIVAQIRETKSSEIPTSPGATKPAVNFKLEAPRATTPTSPAQSAGNKDKKCRFCGLPKSTGYHGLCF